MTTPSQHEEVFARIYARREWGDDESRSGPGSGLTRTAGLRAALPTLLRELEVERILDAGCGDFHWLGCAELAVQEYIGIDVVPELIGELRRCHAAPSRRFVCAHVFATAPCSRSAKVRKEFVGELVEAADRNVQRLDRRRSGQRSEVGR